MYANKNALGGTISAVVTKRPAGKMKALRNFEQTILFLLNLRSRVAFTERYY